MNLSDLELTTADGVVLARLTGEIDLSNARRIEEAIVLAAPNHIQAVVLDLSSLEYLDSAGIQLLYELRQRLQIRGQGLGLVIPEESPAGDALRLAGVMAHLESHETVQSALGAAREDDSTETDPFSTAEVPEVGNRVEE